MNDRLLVLDLDETLWHGGFGGPSGFDPMFDIRPYAGEFLARVAEKWDLAIWTAADPWWATAGLSQLHAHTGFDLKTQAIFFWTKDTLKEEEEIDYSAYARERIYTRFKESARFKLPELTTYKGKILAIDDHKVNYRDDPNHLLLVPEWTVGECDQLELLADYLDHVHDKDFVYMDKRSWNKRPFT